MADDTDLIDWLRLSAVPGLGAERQRSLLAAFGLPRQVFAAGRAAVASVIGHAAADALLTAPKQEWIEAAQAWVEEPGNHILTLADEAYPRTLLDIADPPVLLYVKGDLSRLQCPAIAIVGARTASAQGESNAEA
ncbi:MAG TPA: DNA-processing protein DprA, partial [Thauera sp.]|nr:DNA-processing protein DprA [Thauera sp.]